MDPIVQEAVRSREVLRQRGARGPGDYYRYKVTFDELRIPKQALALVIHHYMDRPDTIMFMISMMMANVFIRWIYQFAFTAVLVLCVVAAATFLVAVFGLFAKAKLADLEDRARESASTTDARQRQVMEGSANRWRIIDDVMRTVLDILFWIIMEMCRSFMDGMVDDGASIVMFITPLTILFAFRGFILVLNPRRLPFPV
jgi:hypothetical protein